MSSVNVSVRDIARASNVSPKTVSRILGGKSHLHKQETVDKVLSVANEMGYRRNLLAQGIFTGRTQTVGVMMRFGLEVEGFFSLMLRGIHDALVDADYAPLLAIPTERVSRVEEVHRLMDRRVDGIILQPSMNDDPIYQDAFRFNIPVVMVDNENPRLLGADFVGTDDFLGGSMAARHLLDLGHRNMAYFTQFAGTPGFEQTALGLRYQGFLDTLKEYPESVCELVDIPFIQDGEFAGYEKARELLSRPNRPTAIFTGMDHLAHGIYQAARSLGLQIPATLSLVGFSDMAFSKYMTPPLSTIRQKPYDIGARAVQLLIERIDGSAPVKETRKIRLVPEMVVRASTAARIC